MTALVDREEAAERGPRAWQWQAKLWADVVAVYEHLEVFYYLEGIECPLWSPNEGSVACPGKCLDI